MTHYAHHIFKVHIADGFTNDCDELIHKCLQLRTLDYQTFCNFWKDFNFGLIYTGRTSSAEIAELTEEVIQIAKHYMVKDTNNIEESVAGLFLVYALIQLQPYPNFACLRIIPDDLPSINRIEVVARRERRLDVLYILGDVLITSTQYHAAERERGFESVLRKYLEGYTSIDKLGVRPKGVFFRQNEELDIIRDLGSVTRQYARAKRSLIGDGKSDPSLQYINENLSNELNTSLKKVINGLLDENTDSTDDNEEEYDHFNSVQAIKQKAMSNTVNSMKNLLVTDSDTVQHSPISKSDLKQPAGKLKFVSPTKPVTNSPKKRKTPMRKGKNKKRKLKSNSQSNDNGAELNLDNFDQVSNKDNNEQMVNIKLEALPTNEMVINTDNIQIDIIDNKAPFSDSDKEKNDSDSASDEDKIVQIFTSQDVKEMAHIETKTPKDSSKISKKTPRIIPIIECKPLVRKKEKQDCKRNKIKSKFKKMGMLPVANFKEQTE